MPSEKGGRADKTGNRYEIRTIMYPDYCVLRFTAQSGRYYRDLKTESFEV